MGYYHILDNNIQHFVSDEKCNDLLYYNSHYCLNELGEWFNYCNLRMISLNYAAIRSYHMLKVDIDRYPVIF